MRLFARPSDGASQNVNCGPPGNLPTPLAAEPSWARDRTRRPVDSVASLPDLPKPVRLRAPLAPPISSRETARRSTQSKQCRETPAPRKTPLENSRPETTASRLNRSPRNRSVSPPRQRSETSTEIAARNSILSCNTSNLVGGGDGGIRTLDRALQPYNGLANRRLQPLGHISGRNARRDICPTPPPIASVWRRSCAGSSQIAIASNWTSGTGRRPLRRAPKDVDKDVRLSGASELGYNRLVGRDQGGRENTPAKFKRETRTG